MIITSHDSSPSSKALAQPHNRQPRLAVLVGGSADEENSEAPPKDSDTGEPSGRISPTASHLPAVHHDPCPGGVKSQADELI